jgi:hypothetical protein
MTPEQERWAEALAVERLYGAAAAKNIAERIASLTLSGDAAGVARWQEICARYDALQSTGHEAAMRAPGAPAISGSPRE